MAGTTVWTEAGNVTFLKDIEPAEIAHLMEQAISQQKPFVSFGSDEMEKSVILAPAHVAALVYIP
jgi:hypothetical protein